MRVTRPGLKKIIVFYYLSTGIKHEKIRSSFKNRVRYFDNTCLDYSHTKVLKE